MNRQPILEGDRLTLRPLRADDWEAAFAAASDPRLWAMHPVHDRWQEPVFRTFFDEGLASGGALAIIDKRDGTLFGSSRYGTSDAEGPGEIQIGWTFIAHRYWGGGWNAELKRLMIGHALRHFERVIFHVGAANVVSRKALANIGGVLTNRTRLFERRGTMTEHVVYEITRECFANGPLMRG